MAAPAVGNRFAESVGGMRLAWGGYIVLRRFYCHESRAADRVKIDFAASKMQVAANKVLILENATYRIEDKLRWEIHHRQCESRKRIMNRIFPVIDEDLTA